MCRCGKERIMIIKKELIKREIAGDVILVPVGTSVYDSNGLYVMNELAEFIWDKLPETENESDIVNAVLAEYEVDKLTAENDVHQFVCKLQELHVI